jgi:GAF domain-containing protein
VADVVSPELAQHFATVARAMHAEDDPAHTYQRITESAVELVPGCDHAAISLVLRTGRVRTVATTGDVPAAVDTIQYETQQGPCLSAIREHETFLIEDLRTADLWPRFSSRAAAETGVRSVLSMRLFAEDDTLGALNLYSREPAAFGEHARNIGTVLAAHAAVAMVAARVQERAENLDVALQTNRIIGVAIGITMARTGLTLQAALTLLTTTSQNRNIKLHDLAETIVETGEPPS